MSRLLKYEDLSVLGRSPGFTVDCFSFELLKKWALDTNHQFQSSTELSNEGRIFPDLISATTAKSLRRFFETCNRVVPLLQYPGANEASRKLFAEGTTAAQVTARRSFNLKWFEDFVKSCGVDDQAGLFVAIRGIRFDWPKERDVTSTDVNRFAGLIDVEIEGRDHAAADEKALHDLVKSLLPTRKLRDFVADQHKQGDTWEDMLTRLATRMNEGERTTDVNDARRAVAQAPAPKKPGNSKHNNKRGRNWQWQDDQQWQDWQWQGEYPSQHRKWQRPADWKPTQPTQQTPTPPTQPTQQQQQPTQRPTEGPKLGPCYKCGQMGHRKADCPSKSNGSKGGKGGGKGGWQRSGKGGKGGNKGKYKGNKPE